MFFYNSQTFADNPHYLDFKFILNKSDAGAKSQSFLKKKFSQIQSIIDIVNFLLIINNPTMNAEPQPIPIKLSLNKGLLYINAIPIYQFPTQY